MQKFINNFETTLSAAITTTTQTTMFIPAAAAVRLGTLTAPDFYLLTLSVDAESNPGADDVEIVKVTAVNTSTGELTIMRTGQAVRGREGSTSQTWAASTTRVSALLTKGSTEALQSGGQRQLTTALASYTVEKGLNGYMLICNSATAQTVSLANDGAYSDPEDYIPIGFRIDIVQRGAGLLTVSVSGSDTIESTLAGSPTTTVDSTGQMGLMSFVKVETDEWLAFGDVA